MMESWKSFKKEVVKVVAERRTGGIGCYHYYLYLR